LPISWANKTFSATFHFLLIGFLFFRLLEELMECFLFLFNFSYLTGLTLTELLSF